MGVFDNLERKLEGVVNGAFARAFKGDVQPVEITARLQKELDAEARLLSRDRKLVPNDFTVYLSAPATAASQCGKDTDWTCASGTRLVINAVGWQAPPATYAGATADFQRYLVEGAVRRGRVGWRAGRAT